MNELVADACWIVPHDTALPIQRVEREGSVWARLVENTLKNYIGRNVAIWSYRKVQLPPWQEVEFKIKLRSAGDGFVVPLPNPDVTDSGPPSGLPPPPHYGSFPHVRTDY